MNNKELAYILHEIDLVTLIKSRPLCWLGHANWTHIDLNPKIGLEGTLEGRKNRNRQWIRWLDEVEYDLWKMGLPGREKEAEKYAWKIYVYGNQGSESTVALRMYCPWCSDNKVVCGICLYIVKCIWSFSLWQCNCLWHLYIFILLFCLIFGLMFTCLRFPCLFLC